MRNTAPRRSMGSGGSLFINPLLVVSGTIRRPPSLRPSSHRSAGRTQILADRFGGAAQCAGDAGEAADRRHARVDVDRPSDLREYPVHERALWERWLATASWKTRTRPSAVDTVHPPASATAWAGTGSSLDHPNDLLDRSPLLRLESRPPWPAHSAAAGGVTAAPRASPTAPAVRLSQTRRWSAASNLAGQPIRPKELSPPLALSSGGVARRPATRRRFRL
jgi:hypothetical protein